MMEGDVMAPVSPDDVGNPVLSASQATPPDDTRPPEDRKGKGRCNDDRRLDAPASDTTTVPAPESGDTAGGGECPVCGILVPATLLAMHVSAHFDGNRAAKTRSASDSPTSGGTEEPMTQEQQDELLAQTLQDDEIKRQQQSLEKRENAHQQRCDCCHRRCRHQKLDLEPGPQGHLYQCSLCGSCTVPCGQAGCAVMARYDPDRARSFCGTHDPAETAPPTAGNCAKWCSWCFRKADHRVVQRGPLQRTVCSCTLCNRRTLACRLCQVAMARGHETWDDELCAKCNRSIREWGQTAVEDFQQKGRKGWCSWCLDETKHIQIQRNLMSRNVFKCARCDGRTIPCIRCPDGMGRAGVGTTDLQCVKCAQAKGARTFSTWSSLNQHVRNQFMICRAHNMDLHTVLMAPSAYRQNAYARGLIRPFLLLVTMDPIVRMNCAHLLGWSYASSDVCGDPHAEAWAILTRKRQGLQARSQELHETIASRPCPWYTILHRALNQVAYVAEPPQDPASLHVLQWCQDPHFRILDALERQLLHSIGTLKRRQPGGRMELYDALMSQLVVEAQGATAPAAATIDASIAKAVPSHGVTPTPAERPAVTVSNIDPTPVASFHRRTASTISNPATPSASRAAVVVPIMTMETSASLGGEGLDELDPTVMCDTTEGPSTPPIGSPPATTPSPMCRIGSAMVDTAVSAGHTRTASVMSELSVVMSAGHNRNASLVSELSEHNAPTAMTEAEVLRTFVQRMMNAGVNGPPQLSFALQTILQLLEVNGLESGIPPFLATLVAAAAPFTADLVNSPDYSPSPAVPTGEAGAVAGVEGPGHRRRSSGDPTKEPSAPMGHGRSVSNPEPAALAGGQGTVFGACPDSPLYMVSWMWHTLDLHAVGSQTQAQALSVVMHLLHQKMFLASQGYSLDPYYGPNHPSCQGPLAPIPSHGSQGSSNQDTETEGHFLGETEAEDAPLDSSMVSRPEPKPAPAAILKAFGSKLEGRVKGLFSKAPTASTTTQAKP